MADHNWIPQQEMGTGTPASQSNDSSNCGQQGLFNLDETEEGTGRPQRASRLCPVLFQGLATSLAQLLARCKHMRPSVRIKTLALFPWR